MEVASGILDSALENSLPELVSVLRDNRLPSNFEVLIVPVVDLINPLS